ncbi:MAG: hypothetical protein MR424_10675 [Treponema sp.]|nr:hypothetical protein [Treponema sp.]MCI6891696.1 hypothetical protein [Treponema sp.]
MSQLSSFFFSDKALRQEYKDDSRRVFLHIHGHKFLEYQDDRCKQDYHVCHIL